MRLKDASQPQDGLGYIVRFADDPATGRQNNKLVQIIAWISKSLRVYPTTVPLTNDPSTNDVEGELHFDAWTDQKNLGAVRIQSNDGLDRTITIGELQLDFSGSGYSTGSLNGIATASSVDLGPYGPANATAATNPANPAHAANTGSAKHPLNSLLAAFWLAAAHFPKLRGEQLGMGAGRIVEIFQNMQNKPLADALDEIIWRGTTNSNTASPFERFAARQLIEAGAGQIREITAENNLDVVQLDSTGQFWMRFNRNEITGLQRDLVLSVEGALNRLAAANRIAAKHDNGMARPPRSPRHRTTVPASTNCMSGTHMPRSSSRAPTPGIRISQCVAPRPRAVACGTSCRVSSTSASASSCRTAWSTAATRIPTPARWWSISRFPPRL